VKHKIETPKKKKNEYYNLKKINRGQSKNKKEGRQKLG
jgi:hypothetical protein